MLFGKYGLHPPLNRQSTAFAREGVELDVAMWPTGSVRRSTLMPLVEAIGTQVFVAERLHVDDTTVPVFDPSASLRAGVGKTGTGRLWVYVRDDRPCAGPAPPGAMYFYSSDRGRAHPEAHLACWQGLMQADAYSGFNRLYEQGR